MPLFKNEKILLIYVEPTPYILGVLKNIIGLCAGQVDVIFLQENISQKWNIHLEKNWKVFPKNKLKRFNFVLEIMRKNKYDLVHIAGWSEPIFVFLLLLSKLYRIPVSIESDTPIPHYTKPWKRIIKRLIYPPLFKLVNLFLPGGKRQAKYLEYFGINLERIIPVQMTVDVASIQKYVKTLNIQNRIQTRRLFGISENAVVYLYVGRLEIHKGINDLISAFQFMNDKNASLLFVGDGSLRNLIESSTQSNSNIYYAGRLTAELLIEAYYAVDVIVLPSHFEPWGLVINEAMAVGKPVIVSDRVGCIDDLITIENGMVTKAENVKDLQLAMELMLSSSEKRIEMGNKSKQLISNWTLENEAENICNAWKKIIAT